MYVCPQITDASECVTRIIGGFRISNKDKRTSDYTYEDSVEHRKQRCSNAYTCKYIHKKLTLRLLMSYTYRAHILDVSRSHTTTHHSRYDSSGRVISSSQRPLPDNTRHSQQTNIHAPSGIRTHDLNRWAAAGSPTLHWYVLYLSENKKWLVPLTP